MQTCYSFTNTNIEQFKKKILLWGNQFSTFVYLDSNNYYQSEETKFSYHDYDFLAGISVKKELIVKDENSFTALQEFAKENKNWIFGYLSYDLKNEIENLKSANIDELQFPEIHFFVPEIVIIGKQKQIDFHYFTNQYTEIEIKNLVEKINHLIIDTQKKLDIKIDLKSRFSKPEYLSTVKRIKEHIQKGDIYEVNLCQEFFFESQINPLETFIQLKEISPTPFSGFYKLKNKYLICASPERFLKKAGTKIISQPIKGTIGRGRTEDEDNSLKEKLLNDPKERSENVMIVDLVRNDLSHTAKKGSVKVEELFGLYSFRQVHQMISTVISEVDENKDIIEIIKNAFPMGSMTGAPKIRAMQLIEKYEKTKRGLYSGAVGYITPERNFDFNVVIRSILYNQSKNYVSFTVGGAITSLSDPEKEYEECMVKAKAITNLFNLKS
ncbi:MAG: anthranilate synthase component I family protein [Bacteroidales bacterium]